MDLYEGLNEKIECFKNAETHKNLLKSIREYYENNANTVSLTADYYTFCKFFDTGSRTEYSSVFKYKRKRLTAAVMLYLVDSDEKYMPEICNMIWLICNEITWADPAHLLSYKAEEYRYAIDLMAASTASQLAEIYYLLSDKLPERIKKTVMAEISDRIFTPFETREFGWEDGHNNWTAVCDGNVGMAYMLLCPERFEGVRRRILAALERFLGSFGDDGCCFEGVGYWSYGLSSYFCFADMYLRFTDGKENILRSVKLDKIALFLQKVLLRDNQPVSFSDCRRRNDFTNIGLFGFLWQTYPGFVMPKVTYPVFDNVEWMLSIALRMFYWWDPGCAAEISSVKEETVYFENAGWYIKKNGYFSFAAKAGHNDEPHNHNDIGSFIISDDSGQMLADIGSMLYTRFTFLPETRYTLLQNSSLGHSVPIIDGKPQKEGRNFYGTVTEHTENTFALELQSAYENAPKTERKFTVENDGVVLCDTFAEPEKHTFTERFVSPFMPKVTSDGVRFGNALLVTKQIPEINEYTLTNPKQKDEVFYSADFDVANGKFCVKIIIEKTAE